MKKFFDYLNEKSIVIVDFENNACKFLDDNDYFISFAKAELMRHYNISSDFENDVDMLLAKILSRKYVFS